MTAPITASEFNDEDHPRATGAKGGQFATKQGTPQQKQTPKVQPRRTPPKVAPPKKVAPKGAPAQQAPLPPLGHSALRRGGAHNDPAQVKQLQALLSELGIGGGGIDGDFGTSTEAAVRAAQAKLGLRETGRVTGSLMRRLTDSHKLSPCVPKSGSAVRAAGWDASLHPHDPLDGRWMKKLQAQINTTDQIESDYGTELADVEFAPDFFVVAHSDNVLTVQVRQEGPDTFEVKAAPDAETARQWADQVDTMLSGIAENQENGTGVAPNGLVDWTIDDGTLVGHYESGDIAVRLGVTPSYTGEQDDLDDYPGFDLGEDEAAAFVEALRDMADAAEDAADEDDRDQAVTAAAGKDTTAGHDELHHYWTRGEGRELWAKSDTPWTTLLANLVRVVEGKSLETLKKWASAWFKEVKGYSSGSDLNRVAHGHKPRGDKVGPG